MFSPGSSSTTLCTLNYSNCQVCGQTAHGKHFGAVTCRACAAFFRRAGVSNTIKPCKRENNCIFLKNGWFNCKKCRLQKCWEVGMSVENFQFDRDTFCPKKIIHLTQKLDLASIPQTMDTFLGRSNLIIFCAPKIENDVFGPFKRTKNFIDVQFLVDKAINVLIQGSESPVHGENALGKLALGLNIIRGSQNKLRSTKIITKIGKEETFLLWQEDILKVARWLTYFDPFRKLTLELQIEMLKNIWKVWSRLENLAITAFGRRLKLCSDEMIMVKVEQENLVCDIQKVEVDISWCSKFTLDQLKFFVESDTEQRTADLIKSMMDLNPSDIELSFMMCQLCFHHVAKKNLPGISEVAEKMQEIIGNDLHSYYTDEMNFPLYAGRVASMMKINNHIHQDIYRGKVKAELAEVFDVFTIEFSHPDMFMEF